MIKDYQLSAGALYHGTRHGEEIRREGFRASTAGGGQMGMRGVFLSLEITEAARYAGQWQGREAYRPEVLSVAPAGLRLADLAQARHATDVWKMLGLDWRTDHDAALIREKVWSDPFALTTELLQMGFHGAAIPNTITPGGPPEIVVFYPAMCRPQPRNGHTLPV